jgi:hypothetical protein
VLLSFAGAGIAVVLYSVGVDIMVSFKRSYIGGQLYTYFNNK